MNVFLEGDHESSVDITSGTTPAYLSELRLRNIGKDKYIKTDNLGNLIGAADIDLKEIENDIDELQNKTEGIEYKDGDTIIEESLIIQGNEVNRQTRINDDIITLENKTGDTSYTSMAPNLINIGQGHAGIVLHNGTAPLEKEPGEIGLYLNQVSSSGYLNLGASIGPEGGTRKLGVLNIGGGPGKGTLNCRGKITAESLDLGDAGDLICRDGVFDRNLLVNNVSFDSINNKTQGLSYNDKVTSIYGDLKVEPIDEPGIQYSRIFSNNFVINEGAPVESVENAIQLYTDDGLEIKIRKGDDEFDTLVDETRFTSVLGPEQMKINDLQDKALHITRPSLNHTKITGVLEVGTIDDVEQAINKNKNHFIKKFGVVSTSFDIFEDENLIFSWNHVDQQYMVSLKRKGQSGSGAGIDVGFVFKQNDIILTKSAVDNDLFTPYFFNGSLVKDPTQDVNTNSKHDLMVMCDLDVYQPYPSYRFEILHLLGSTNVIIQRFDS